MIHQSGDIDGNEPPWMMLRTLKAKPDYLLTADLDLDVDVDLDLDLDKISGGEELAVTTRDSAAHSEGVYVEVEDEVQVEVQAEAPIVDLRLVASAQRPVGEAHEPVEQSESRPEQDVLRLVTYTHLPFDSGNDRPQ